MKVCTQGRQWVFESNCNCERYTFNNYEQWDPENELIKPCTNSQWVSIVPGSKFEMLKSLQIKFNQKPANEVQACSNYGIECIVNEIPIFKY